MFIYLSHEIKGMCLKMCKETDAKQQ